MKKVSLLILVVSILLVSCKKEDKSDTTSPNIVFKFKFDSTQVRLDNFGNPETVPAGHGAQSPDFKQISAHYIELAQNQFTLLGAGEILYKGEETNAGGSAGVNFDKSTVVSEGEVFQSIPISSISPGNYDWVRVSLTYQNYDVKLKHSGVSYTGNLASFVGFNTYISDFKVGGEKVAVNDDKLQGYWTFKVAGIPYPTIEGQVPAGATTVPNPNFANSPIPQGSCVVTGQFTSGLTITGNETEDVVVTLSISTNNSFEWEDQADDNIYEPSAGDAVVNMGLRGLIPIVE